MVDWWKNECDHEWEVIEEEEGTFRTSTCIICGCTRFQDFVKNTEKLVAPDRTDEDLPLIGGTTPAPPSWDR